MKRCLALFLAIILFVGTFSTNAMASDTNSGELSNEKVLYSSDDTYSVGYNSGPFIKVSVNAKEVERKFLWLFPYKASVSSILFEVFEDKEQTILIAQYRSKEKESRIKKNGASTSVNDIIKHDKALKNKGVHDLISKISQLEYSVASLEPACANVVALQKFYVNNQVVKLANSSSNAFCEVVNEIVDAYVDEVSNSVVSSFVDVAANCIKEVDEINKNSYKDPDKKSFLETLKDFIISLFSSDKPDEPNAEGKSIIAQAYAKAGKNILETVVAINMGAIYNDELLVDYNEVLENDKKELVTERRNLCNIIIDLDTENK